SNPGADPDSCFRPRLEILEQRCMPTTVTNLLDDFSAGSLRVAIANTAAGGIVNFAGGLTGQITLVNGEIAINKNLLIQGPGAAVLTVSGNNASRIFNVNGTGILNVTITGLTLTSS